MSKRCNDQFSSGRRQFLKTSAGLAAWAAWPGYFHIFRDDTGERFYDFRPYRRGKTLGPVQCITPDDGFYLHTFFDVCPWSISGNYFAVTRFPYQQKKPQWGDTAEVCVINLKKQSIKTVYTTKAWSFQLGANVQWSNLSDRYLYTNDIIDGQIVCVRIDLENNTTVAYAGSKYDIAPDDQSVISPNLANMNMTQYGYSVPDPASGRPVPFTKADMPGEGLWKTDLVNNKRVLLAAFPDFIAQAEEKEFYSRATLYLFHSKYNPQNTRILQVLRAQVNDKGRNASLFTMHTDGSHIIQCLSKEKWNHKARLGGSGNHPNWHPDGEHIIMNCIPKWLGYDDMLFCRFRYDGSGFTILSEKHPGSGHPSIEPRSRYLLADAYPKQSYVVSANGEIPIRLVDLEKDEEKIICSIANDVGGGGRQYLEDNDESGGSQYKLDPHPVWDRNYKQIAFNGAPQGKRQVYIADIAQLVN